ncbi:MAG TPA: 3-oxo-tetronate 4-phosphate decarboxylase [Candidatus Acidoferrales bacterium]|nr:3-oxo-tetronate 4-phosphate decarboxylase [Candidatus Acidoferrales bacterium]
MTHSSEREALCKAGAHLSARGLSPGTSGNISVRVDDGWIVTPSNASMGALAPESLAFIDANGARAGGAEPTKEKFLHAAVYAARNDFGAIVHLHSTHAVAYACLRDLNADDAFPPITPYTVMRLGRVALVPYVRPGDPRLGELVGEAAHRHHAILLANHGPVVAATSLEAAVAAIEELEESAKLYFLLHGHKTQFLSDEHVGELRSVFAS